MTLAEILKLTQWSEIEACLRGFERGTADDDEFPYVESHRHAYAQICELRPKPCDTVIVISTWINDHETKELDAKADALAAPLDVSGIEPGKSEELGLSLTRWDEWLGMEVAPSARQHLTPAEIVTHCLWEMTFNGYDFSDVEAVADELHSTWEEVERRLDSEQDDEREADDH